MAPSVRTATPADIATLVALMDEFYAEAGFTLDLAGAARTFERLLSDPSLGVVWLMSFDSEPAGYLVLTTRFSMEFGGLDGFIDDLFVRPSYRRRGLSALGLSALLAEARRRSLLALHVEVGVENGPAQALYRGIGMTPGEDRRQKLSRLLGAEVQHQG